MIAAVGPERPAVEVADVIREHGNEFTASPSSNAGNCCSRRMLTCRYFAVVLKWLWPNSAWTESKSTPASSKWVAKL